MGWDFKKGATKKDIVADLVAELPRTPGITWSNSQQKCLPSGFDVSHKTLVYKVTKDNVLWAVVEETKYYPDREESKRILACFILENNVGYGWGYKSLCEEMHPFYYSCPLDFFDLVPETNAKWREAVRTFQLGYLQEA